jgi:hypothetical protein
VLVRRLEDLQPIHRAGMNPTTEAKLRQMSANELFLTVTSPRNGQKIKVRPGDNRVLDGNTRVHEMLRRMADPASKFKPGTPIPVEEIRL